MPRFSPKVLDGSLSPKEPSALFWGVEALDLILGTSFGLVTRSFRHDMGTEPEIGENQVRSEYSVLVSALSG